MHLRPAFSVAWAKLALDGLARAAVRDTTVRDAVPNPFG